MPKLTLEEMELLVDVRDDMHWDGWTAVHTKPNKLAIYRPDGMRIGNRWYTAKRFSPQSDGKYHVPKVLGHGI